MMRLRGTLLVLATVAAGFLRAMAMTEDAVQGAYVRSYGYERVQDYDNAMKVLSDVLYMDSQGYFVNLRMGWLNYLQGHYADARTYYQSAIKAVPDSIEAKLGYMLPLLAQARYGEVETAAREILAMDSGNYYANLRLAYVLRLQAKHSQAEAVLVPMLGRHPADTSFLLELGLNQVALKKNGSARKTFTTILRCDPENVIARAQLYYLQK